jgi:translation initiation factor IF-3
VVGSPSGWLIRPDATLPELVGWQRRRGYARTRECPERGASRIGGPAGTICGAFWLLVAGLRSAVGAKNPRRSARGWSLSMSTVTQGGHISTEPRINERIRVPEVRLVGPAGEQVGIVAINDALRLAQEADLDLVEVAPMARPPVCKLMDYGKFKYESALKARESRKNQAQTVIKEIKLRPKIDPHDYGTKKGHVERFLKQGDKVKVTIMFRGREQSRPELGFKLLQRLAGDIEELGFVESSPKQDGRNMIMVLGPHKRKTEALAAAKADRASRSSARSAEHAAAQESASAESAAVAEAAPPSDTPSASNSSASNSSAASAGAPASSAPTAGTAPARSAAADAESNGAGQARAESTRAESARAGSARPESGSAEQASTEQANTGRASTEPTRAAAPPRPATPRPSAPARSSAAPKPTAPRATPAGSPRPGPAGSGAPKPSAPRGTTASPRPSASTAPKPGPARRNGDGPVPAPRAVAADRGGAKESGEADS